MINLGLAGLLTPLVGWIGWLILIGYQPPDGDKTILWKAFGILIALVVVCIISAFNTPARRGKE